MLGGLTPATELVHFAIESIDEQKTVAHVTQRHGTVSSHPLSPSAAPTEWQVEARRLRHGASIIHRARGAASGASGRARPPDPTGKLNRKRNAKNRQKTRESRRAESGHRKTEKRRRPNSITKGNGIDPGAFWWSKAPRAIHHCSRPNSSRNPVRDAPYFSDAWTSLRHKPPAAELTVDWTPRRTDDYSQRLVRRHRRGAVAGAEAL